MTTAPRTTSLPPMTVPFTERLSERWLLERTYHAQLRHGKELPVSGFTRAMKQLNDFDVPPSRQSSTSKLVERIPLKKSTNFYVPLSTWKEISQGESSTSFQQGIPVLLFGEHAWKHSQNTSPAWSASKNMRAIISGRVEEQAHEVSGTDYAVCYLDLQRGTFSNTAWKAWFASDAAAPLEGGDRSDIIFLVPSMQFPYTTHYTVITADGQVYEYATSAEAFQRFLTLPLQEVSSGSQAETVCPQFSYYHEVTCPSGIYRLEFFGQHMDEELT